jgi:cyclase
VARTAAELFIPLTVGGGVRSIDDVRRLLLAGADKASINSAAVAEPELVSRAAEAFGSQCIVVAVDARAAGPAGGRCSPTAAAARPDSTPWNGRGGWRGRGGRDPADLHGPRRHQVRLRHGLVAGGPGRDGGADHRVGGVGEAAHFVEGARAGATGLLAASVFHYGELRVADAKAALAAAGLPVRPMAAAGAA